MSITAEYHDIFNANARDVAPVFDADSFARRADALGITLMDIGAIKDDIPPLESVAQYPTEFQPGARMSALPRAELSCVHLSGSDGLYRDSLICKEGLAQYMQNLKPGQDITAGIEAKIEMRSGAGTALADQFSIASLAAPGLLAPSEQVSRPDVAISAPVLNPFGNG